MVRKSIVACVCIGGIILGAAAIAQPDKGNQPAAPAGMPGPEDMAKMMERWEKAATPGKMHERLMKSVGTWDGKTTSWMNGPDAPPSTSTCKTVITGMMGGRFTRGETKGSFDMGGPEPMPFEGFGIYGYNNSSNKFESTWCDSLGTMMVNLTGKLSEDGKTLTWDGKFYDPMTEKDSWMRLVETSTGPDGMTLEMFGPGFDGKDAKMMRIDYTRAKGDAKPGAGK